MKGLGIDSFFYIIMSFFGLIVLVLAYFILMPFLTTAIYPLSASLAADDKLGMFFARILLPSVLILGVLSIMFKYRRSQRVAY